MLYIGHKLFWGSDRICTANVVLSTATDHCGGSYSNLVLGKAFNGIFERRLGLETNGAIRIA